ncbi:MAG: helix-turn-helix domain-containing protein [Micromonosporaceae bacterium]|nr:helix-turn-helix domain-containing protein [Micromonosporaceae bacterium]
MTAPAQPPFPEAVRRRFARFIDRALKRASDMGISHRQIAEASGVGTSTFHRWRRGELRELPELDRVRAFCAAAGASFTDAMAALGLAAGRDNPEPEPVLPAEVRIILRYLADPTISDRDKLVVRETLLMLADRARRRRRDEGVA